MGDVNKVRDRLDEALAVAMADRDTWGMDAEAMDSIPTAPLPPGHNDGP